MPPKGKQGGGGGKASSRKAAAGGGASANDFLKTDDVLQAVLLADSFDVKFRPITLQKPKVLLPLLNIPLLEYSLEFLVSGGVQELFIFACAHAPAIQAYLDDESASAASWRRRKGITVRVVVSEACYSFGDALRHLDTLDLIKSDFILLSGDVVANLPLAEIVKTHKDRVAKDKRNLMTMLFKPAAPQHRTRSLNDDAILALDPSTSQLLAYENEGLSRKVHLDQLLLAEAKQPIQLRYDLLDCHIAVCTPEVLMLFTDNFDWQTFHSDFLVGVLGSEILGNKIYVHTLDRGQYAARVTDLRTYDAVSSDVAARWAYPLVPDNNLLGGFGGTSYKFTRGNIYKEEGVTISREAKLGEGSMVGSGSNIAARAVVERSVLGRDVSIGSGAVVRGSYLFKGVVLEEGAQVERALLAEGVIIRKGARIGRGAILGAGVVIGPGFEVAPYTRITTARNDEDEEGNDEDDEDEDGMGDIQEEEGEDRSTPSRRASTTSTSSSSSIHWAESEVGPGGVGRVYHGLDEQEEEEEEEAELVTVDGEKLFPFRKTELNSIAPNPAAVASWVTRAQRVKREDGDESEDEWDFDEEEMENDMEDGEEDEEVDPALANQLGSSAMGAGAAGSGGAALNLHFHKYVEEVGETLARGHEEKLPLEDISLEMSGLKFSHNTTVEEMAHATFLALFALVHRTVHKVATAGKDGETAHVILDPSRNKLVMNALGSLLKSWHPILAKFAGPLTDQVNILGGLEAACVRRGFVPCAGVNSANPNPSGDNTTSPALTELNSEESVYTLLFTPTLQLLYDRFPIISEEAIEMWAEQTEESQGENHILLKQSEAFRNWLQEADEEEDEDEEDEDEE